MLSLLPPAGRTKAVYGFLGGLQVAWKHMILRFKGVILGTNGSPLRPPAGGTCCVVLSLQFLPLENAGW